MRLGFKSFDHYINGDSTLGFATGTLSILAYWITGNTILAAPEATVRLGILGAFGYSLIGSIALIGFAPFAHLIKKKFPAAKTVGSFYRLRFGQGTSHVLLAFVFLYMFITLVTQGQGIGYMLENVFGIDRKIAIVFTFLICILYSSIGGFEWIKRIGIFQVIMMMTVTIILPAIVYFQVDLPRMYERIQSLHPEALRLDSYNGLLFIVGGVTIGVGQVFMDNVFWQRNYIIRKRAIIPSYLISGLAWAVIPFAFSSLVFVTLAKDNEMGNITRILFNVVNQYGHGFGVLLLLAGVWSAITSTIALTLNSITSLIFFDVFPFKKETDIKKQIKISGWMTIFLGVISMFVSLQEYFSMLDLILLFGVINAAFIAPMMASIASSKLNGRMAVCIVFLSVIIGFWVASHKGTLEGVIASGLSSTTATATIQLMLFLKARISTNNETITVNNSAK